MKRFAPLGAALLAFAVLAGAVDHRPAGETHILLEASGDLVVSSLAAHPNLPLHFEGEWRTTAKRRHAPIYLQRTSTKSASLHGTLSVAPPELRSIAPGAPDLSAAGAAHPSTGARAPPLA